MVAAKASTILFLLLVGLSCTEPQKSSGLQHEVKPIMHVDTVAASIHKTSIKNDASEVQIDTLEQKMIDAGLINVSLLNPEIRVNLRYATDSNFLNQVIYKDLKRAYLEENTAKKLAIAQILLNTKNPDYKILVWDAARPISCQKKMWYALDMPPAEKGRFVSNPKNHSLHNYGCAVDVTLCDTAGNPIEMGTDFDQFDSLAQPRYEWRMKYTGQISEEAVKNRQLLRTVMKEAGFTTLSSEWWHFNSCSRDFAKTHFQVID